MAANPKLGATAPLPGKAAAPQVAAASTPKQAEELVFGPLNYTLMLAAIGTIFLGYIIMTMEKATYGFGFLGLTLGPIFCLAGFILAAVSILFRKKTEVKS